MEDNRNLETDAEEVPEEQKESEEAESAEAEENPAEAGDDSEQKETEGEAEGEGEGEAEGAEAVKEEGAEEVEPEPDEEDEDHFSLLGDDDTEEQRQMYHEYLRLLKDIRAQNNIIAQLKLQKAALCAKGRKNSLALKEAERFQSCIEKEKCKLKEMIRKAVKLQNFGSKRAYDLVPVETDLDDDNFCGCGLAPRCSRTSCN